MQCKADEQLNNEKLINPQYTNKMHAKRFSYELCFLRCFVYNKQKRKSLMDDVFIQYTL